jgi:hypothetical protein
VERGLSEGLGYSRARGVVELKATLDRRDEMLRATAVEIKPLAAARPNGATERSEDITGIRDSSAIFLGDDGG